MVTRDSYQSLRDETGRRMITPEAREIYKARASVIEGVFAVLRHHMNIRSFLLRGLDKVRGEWSWICTAYNLKKITNLLPSIGNNKRYNPHHNAHIAPPRTLQARKTFRCAP